MLRSHNKASAQVLVHAFSVDVEDWNNGVLLLFGDRVVPPTKAVVANVERLLDLFRDHSVRATWFVLGEVADAYPEVIRLVGQAEHELGVHGYHHLQVHRQSRDRFREDVLRAKDAVERAGGKEVFGHRAVAFSIGEGTWDALGILAQIGFRYDSSVFPFRGSRYGARDAPLTPWRIQTELGEIVEIPMSVLDIGPFRLPGCGGGYLRHFPLAYTRIFLRALDRKGRSAVLYLHPYEIDFAFDTVFFAEHAPSVSRARFRLMKLLQYRGRRQTIPKLKWLMQHYRWAPIAEVFEPSLRASQKSVSDGRHASAADTIIEAGGPVGVSSDASHL